LKLRFDLPRNRSIQPEYIQDRLILSSATMHQTKALLASCAALTSASASKPLSFGQNYAVLNLDLINGVVAPLANTTEGRKWINSTATWINACVYLPPSIPTLPPHLISFHLIYTKTRPSKVGQKMDHTNV
jgi:hypothetical protein